MRDLTIGVFEHLEIISAMDVYKSIKYTQRILRVMARKKYKRVLEGLKESEKGIAEYQWALRSTKDVNMEQLLNWAKIYALDGLRDM